MPGTVIDKEALLKERARRREDRELIKRTCHRLFKVSCRPGWLDGVTGSHQTGSLPRAKRGRVHEMLAQALGEKLNNDFVQRVKRALAEMGAVEVNFRGELQWLGLEIAGEETRRKPYTQKDPEKYRSMPNRFQKKQQ